MAPVEGPEVQVGIDEQGSDVFHKVLHQSRIGKASAYYRTETNFHELAVYAVLVEACDARLLYPLMGDPVQDPSRQSKLEKLHDRESSLIGACQQEYVHLAESWARGGPHRRPWCILETLNVPLEEPNFLMWSRGQLMRLASSVFRRYEVKHSGYPFALWPLVSPKHSEEERRLVAKQLLQEPRQNLDTYSSGIRLLFPIEEALLSNQCHMVLSKDFAAQGYGTDVIERANAELTAATPKSAPGRSFANAAREALLRQ